MIPRRTSSRSSVSARASSGFTLRMKSTICFALFRVFSASTWRPAGGILLLLRSGHCAVNASCHIRVWQASDQWACMGAGCWVGMKKRDGKRDGWVPGPRGRASPCPRTLPAPLTARPCPSPAAPCPAESPHIPLRQRMHHAPPLEVTLQQLCPHSRHLYLHQGLEQGAWQRRGAQQTK